MVKSILLLLAKQLNEIETCNFTEILFFFLTKTEKINRILFIEM